jgi:sugar lactone lactonase YvrE
MGPLFWLLLGLAVLVALAVVTAGPVDPVAYTTPEAPAMVGPLTPNTDLCRAEHLVLPGATGPEDLAIDGEGRIYTGVEDGRILVREPNGAVRTLASTGGRPLGMHLDAAGNLIVADAYRGILKVSPAGVLEPVVTHVDGRPLLLTNEVDIASDGKLYFSDSSDRFSLADYPLDLLDGRPHGRLFEHDPATGVTRTLLSGLFFANGVILTPEEDAVLVAESWRYRITRYWLKGPKAGTAEPFATDLPGFPDNLSRSPRGTYWVAIFTLRNAQADFASSRVWLKRILSRLPMRLWVRSLEYGLALELSAEGKVLRTFHDPFGRCSREVTAVEEHDGHLYLGTLHGDYIARLKL